MKTDKLIEFVVRFCDKELKQKIDPCYLTNDTSLEDDLHITGDDADYFFEAFVREFNVDLSEFEGKKYFGVESESTDVIWPILRVIFGKNKKWMPLAKKDRRPLTLGMLEEAIRKGKLV